jgi:hypothetical protein
MDEKIKGKVHTIHDVTRSRVVQMHQAFSRWLMQADAVRKRIAVSANFKLGFGIHLSQR